MRKRKRKLRLTRETLRNLNESTLRGVAGGTFSGFQSCHDVSCRNDTNCDTVVDTQDSICG
ncbi:MAG: hypothetical protein D6696_12180 [Acidobacteria bacterium]|nr:MAG: hypothetical protein D6696_12180 [Acidobacteriota bacterium]